VSAGPRGPEPVAKLVAQSLRGLIIDDRSVAGRGVADALKMAHHFL
jgi:hypothetical protein